MPDKGFSVATYAAGASLATIALVYVFAPTYFLDNNPSTSSNPLASLTNRKTGIVGLANAANDCFINSVLQALAGLGDLRIYLIRETHRRTIDDDGVYSNLVPQDAVASSGDGTPGPSRRPMPAWKIEGLQAGLVTKGLKNMIDQLNERPIYRKVITAGPFVRVLEVAFHQRISRQQQDAQEFLQVVAERLCDEYHAGQRARRFARRRAAMEASSALGGATDAAAQAAAVAPLDTKIVEEKLASLAAAANGGGTAEQDPRLRQAQGQENVAPLSSSRSSSSESNTQTKAKSTNGQPRQNPKDDETDDRGDKSKREKEGEGDHDDDEDEDGFPMEGQIESQIECLTCGFKPRSSKQTFCTLTLNVPQVSSTSLSACFDSMLKTEYIDDFKCEKCRLVHAKQMFEAEAAKSASSESFRSEAKQAIAALQAAIETDPERPPPRVTLPDVRYAPKRRIARHFRLVTFPKVLAIHLSRSIYDAANMSQKNSAKVAFPERLPLGGLLQQRKYKLISVVMHKGNHHSGHYESFRRQTVSPPYSNPNTFCVANAYSSTTTPAATTPKIGTSDAATGVSPLAGGSPVSSESDLPPAAYDSDGTAPPPDTASIRGSKRAAAAVADRVSRSSSLRARASSLVLPPPPTSAPRGPLPGDEAVNENFSGNGNGNGNAKRSNSDAAAETSSLRSITRSTWSRIAPSSRSGSRAGSRNGSHQSGSRSGSQSRASHRFALRPSSKNGAASETTVLPATAVVTAAETTTTTNGTASGAEKKVRRKKTQDRWWRISDERVREASTREVLGMQREVYLLFYELERDPYTG
ncbi:ubiquitin hydrolase [Niveomyces insectorum RCEF 264]|uniref:Ubiquitin carboxyl-terminal hydrolase n=1 Tax=Niveomyces insectorum RCEF 264 TaxID=1081102 RepID=A0A167QRY4_9HYPO|nr:ubiquitin hydrolase [Niveomyces insectorum RCEF 264]